MEKKVIMGVDVGASGIKGGLVDINTGKMLTERHRLETPQPPTPEAMAEVFAQLVQHFDWKGPIGCGFPAIVHKGIARSAANIDQAWIDKDICKVFGDAVNQPVFVLNDADAAGVASMHYGVGRAERGTVLMLTIGSGIGSALFLNGHLIPNTEFGHIYMKGDEQVVEKTLSGRARKSAGLSWEEWGEKFDVYLHHLERMVSPDLLILGGGGAKHFATYESAFTAPFPVQPANYLNKAGTVGAAYFAYKMVNR